jgi:hypothetical protein
MGGDLVEGQIEHVVQDEREPLSGSERVKHNQQREADRVGQQRLGLGPGRLVVWTDEEVAHVDLHRGFPSHVT